MVRFMRAAMLNNTTRANQRSRNLRVIGQCGLWVLLAVLALGTLRPAGAQSIRLRNAQFDPLTLTAPTAADQATALAKGEGVPLLVQWATPPTEAQLQALIELGCQMVVPVPDHAYLVIAPASALGALQAAQQDGALAPRWVAPLRTEWKLEPEASRAVSQWRADASGGDGQALPHRVQIAHTGAQATVEARLRQLCDEVSLHSAWPAFDTWSVVATPGAIAKLALENSVIWIETSPLAQLMGEREALAVAGSLSVNGNVAVRPDGGYQAWLQKVGVSGVGVLVHMMDSGLSKGIFTGEEGSAHPDLLGRIAKIDNFSQDPNLSDVGGHGTLNASLIMGQPKADGTGKAGANPLKDSGGFFYGQGVAPGARVYMSKVFNNNGIFANPRLDNIARFAYEAGARISNNSWGRRNTGGYDTDAQLFDRLTRDANLLSTTTSQPMLFVFAAGNNGPGARTLASPATAKNVISVGASENSDAGQEDALGIGPGDSNNLKDMELSSGRGPTLDGRLAPTLVAPGTHLVGAASDAPGFTGVQLVWRKVVEAGEAAGAAKYFPAFQKDYTRSSGSSHATALVTGAATLMFEYFKQQTGKEPSPALLRAALVAGARDMMGGQSKAPGAPTLDGIPNNNQGWGRASVDRLLDGSNPHYFMDQQVVLRTAGDEFETRVAVTNADQPLKIVLAWSDPFAAPFAQKILINDLDLIVSDGENEYLGNVMQSGNSVTGGNADRVNNLESVVLKVPRRGVYTLRVRANSLSGSPLNNGKIEQDFALFILNAEQNLKLGEVSLDRTIYNISQQPLITLLDPSVPAGTQPRVDVLSLQTGDVEKFSLAALAGSKDVFTKKFTMNSQPKPNGGDGVLTVAAQDTIRVIYVDDVLDDNGQPRKSIVEAAIDSTVPQVTSEIIEDIGGSTAAITVHASEPVGVILKYGLSPTTLNSQVSNTQPNVTQVVQLTGLQNCTPYYYTVTLVDVAGNRLDLPGAGQAPFDFRTLNGDNTNTCITALALLQFASLGFNCTQNELFFTVRDSGLAAGGKVPTEYRLITPDFPQGVPVAPRGLRLIDDAGVWEGYLPLTPGSSGNTRVVAGVSEIGEGQSVRLIYEDNDDGNGQPATVSTTAVLDCQPPQLIDLRIAATGDNSVTLQITPSEIPLTATVRYGKNPGEFTSTVTRKLTRIPDEFQISGLEPNTRYYYDLTLADDGGSEIKDDNFGSFFHFTTQETVIWEDDLEPDPVAGWTHQAALGADQWQLTFFGQSPTPDHVWFVPNSENAVDSDLRTPSLAIGTKATFSFLQTFQLESGHDGGVLEISTNGGSSWEDLGPHITQGGYTGAILTNVDTALNRRFVWTGGALGAMLPVVVDLSSYAGKQARIRLRLVTDQGGAQSGWYCDQFQLQSIRNDGVNVLTEPVFVSPTGASPVDSTQIVTLVWTAQNGGDEHYRVTFGPAPDAQALISLPTSPVAYVAGDWMKAGLPYYWQVESWSGLGYTRGALQSYTTELIPAQSLAEQIVGKQPGLTQAGVVSSDYNNNGRVDVTDLVTNVNLQNRP